MEESESTVKKNIPQSSPKAVLNDSAKLKIPESKNVPCMQCYTFAFSDPFPWHNEGRVAQRLVEACIKIYL